MQANADLAVEVGVPGQMVGCNGDLFMLAPQPGVCRGAANVGRLGLEGNSLAKIQSG